VLVGIRAENIRTEVEPFPDALRARTRVVEPLGSHLLITADVGEQPIKVTAPADFPAHPQPGAVAALRPGQGAGLPPRLSGPAPGARRAASGRARPSRTCIST
jgi:hypothetical protein